MPISNHQLTHQQLIDLNALARRCKWHDRNTVPLYNSTLKQRRSLPCNLLYYHNQQLVGFLSVFFFYENAAEIVLMVDPAWRRQHIAARLIAVIMPVIHTRNLELVRCPSPKDLNTDWLPTRGFCYQNTECHMQWKGAHPTEAREPNYTISQATDKDISTLVDINATCFSSEKTGMDARFHQLLHDESYNLFIIHYNNQPIGKAHAHQEDFQVQLSDIAILPSFQRRGFGQALVSHCIRHIVSTSSLPICLDVEFVNQSALKLYEKLGFKIVNAWDFWAIPCTALSLPTK